MIRAANGTACYYLRGNRAAGTQSACAFTSHPPRMLLGTSTHRATVSFSSEITTLPRTFISRYFPHRAPLCARTFKEGASMTSQRLSKRHALNYAVLAARCLLHVHISVERDWLQTAAVHLARAKNWLSQLEQTLRALEESKHE